MSTLLPYHNATTTLDRAIESIVGQTFRDWELLLIDNASTDQGSSLAAKWAQTDSRIRLAHCPEKGIAHALNHGLSLASSPFIARMDADDWSHPERLEKQVAYLDQHPEIGVVSCQTTFQSSAGRAEGYEHFVNWQNSIITPQEHWVNRFKESPVAHPTVMFRREVVQAYGGYNIEAIPEDYELWLRWMEAGVRFSKIPEQLLIWNDDPSRLSRNHSNYFEEAFFKVKGQYLSRWMHENVSSEREVVACGTSKECRQRAQWLMGQGVRIDYLTDVVPRQPSGFEFLSYEEIKSPDKFLVLNLIGNRTANQQVKIYFIDQGFSSGASFMALI